MDNEGVNQCFIFGNLDCIILDFMWVVDGKGLIIIYDDWGDIKVVYLSIDGKVREIMGQLGGIFIG